MKMQSEELSVDTLVEFLTNKVEPGLKLVCQQREQKLGEQTNKQKVSLRSDWTINSARKQETAERWCLQCKMVFSTFTSFTQIL